MPKYLKVLLGLLLLLGVNFVVAAPGTYVSIDAKIRGSSAPAHTKELSRVSSPMRIASVNICLDQLLWQLLPRNRLVSFSYLTADPMWSPIAAQVAPLIAQQQLSLNHGLAEEIVPLKPDIVLAGEFDSADTVDLLLRLGARVERLALPRTLDDIPAQIRSLAQLVGAEPQAEQLIQNINHQLEILDAVPKADIAPTAFWYSSNGVVIGGGTLEHELMQRAGLRNLAAERGIQGFAPLDLELLISAKPQFIIIEESNASAYSLAREYLAHPLLRQDHFKIVRLPSGLSGCAATAVEEVALALKDELKLHHPQR